MRESRIQEAKSPQVDLVVSPERLRDRTLGLGECGWVEDDEVETPPSAPAPQQIERVSSRNSILVMPLSRAFSAAPRASALESTATIVPPCGLGGARSCRGRRSNRASPPNGQEPAASIRFSRWSRKAPVFCPVHGAAR